MTQGVGRTPRSQHAASLPGHAERSDASRRRTVGIRCYPACKSPLRILDTLAGYREVQCVTERQTSTELPTRNQELPPALTCVPRVAVPAQQLLST